MQNIRFILEHTLKKMNCNKKFKENLLFKIWDEVTGEHISKQAQPESIQNSTLFVKVATPAWVKELESMKPMIVERLNRRAGEEVVKDLHFQVGEIPPRKTTDDRDNESKWLQAEVDKDCLKNIQKEVMSIKDPQIRKIITSIMVKDTKLRSVERFAR